MRLRFAAAALCAASVTFVLAPAPFQLAQAQVPAPKPAAKPPAGKPAPRQVDDRRYAELAGEAEAAYQRGDFPGTEAAAQRALEEGARAYGGEHANLGRALNVLGAAFLRQGKFSEAVFGSLDTYPDHARRALKASIGMAEAAAGFRSWMEARFPDRGLAPFGIGVGLHTGEAVIGNIGSAKRIEFTAIGDTVNAASRLEGVTKDMQCVVAASEATVLAAGPGVRTGKVETLQVKGRHEPLRVMEVLGVDDGQG